MRACPSGLSYLRPMAGMRSLRSQWAFPCSGRPRRAARTLAASSPRRSHAQNEPAPFAHRIGACFDLAVQRTASLGRHATQLPSTSQLHRDNKTAQAAFSNCAHKPTSAACGHNSSHIPLAFRLRTEPSVTDLSTNKALPIGLAHSSIKQTGSSGPHQASHLGVASTRDSRSFSVGR